jgi:response regulator NasT
MAVDEPENLRVLIADELNKFLEPIAAAVRELGHRVIAREVDPSKTASETAELQPDIAIVVLHEHTDHALRLIAGIVDEATCPVMALVEGAEPDFVAAAAEQGIFAYLDSAEETELRGGIDVALQRFGEYQRLRSAFGRRARIERAKGILMERHSITEDEAFERLRSEARNSRRRLLDIVDDVLGDRSGAGF